MVPARRSREIVVKTGQLRVDGAPTLVHISREVVDSVNKALGVREALAARRLDSGDTVVIFQEYALRYKVDNAWIKEAFGEEVTQARRELIVLAKEIPTGALKAAHSQKEQLLKDL